MDYLVDVRLVVIGYINIYDLFMCKKKYGFRVGFFLIYIKKNIVCSMLVI